MFFGLLQCVCFDNGSLLLAKLIPDNDQGKLFLPVAKLITPSVDANGPNVFHGDVDEAIITSFWLGHLTNV